MRVCAVNGTNVRVRHFLHRACAHAEFLLGQHDDAAAFGCFVGERRQLRGVGMSFIVDAGRGKEFDGLAVAERDRAGLVEQQHVHVAGGLDRAAAHRQHILLHQPVHARDADGAEQPADGGRNQADQQRDQHGDRKQRRRNKCRTASA